jgi:restriction endonuclease S subunit
VSIAIKVVVPSLEIQRSLVAEIEAAQTIQTQKLSQADELLSSLDVYLLDLQGHQELLGDLLRAVEWLQ